MSTVIKWDPYCLFCFAPLSGQTADKWLTGKRASLRSLNTLVLVEDFKGKKCDIWVRAQAVFRIFWLLGGFFKPIGILFFLPAILINPFYCVIASLRHHLAPFKIEEKDKKRFLK